MLCKYTLKQIESNLANVMSRSRTINALDIHCMRSECHGVPSISNTICRENVLDILSGFNQRVEMISFNYHDGNAAMKLDVVENAAVELQNLASGSRNAINVINKALRTENRNGGGERKKEGKGERKGEGDGNSNNNHLCNLCSSIQRRDLVALTQVIKKNPLEAKKIMLENKEHIQCLGKINKNNGCSSCISKYVSSYTSSIKSFPTSQFYKDFVYTSEEDYGSLFSGMNTKTGMRHTGDDKRKQFKEFVIEPYDVRGYQVFVKRNQKNIAGHDIVSSDFNLYQYSVGLDNRNLSLMKTLSDEIKDTILERSKSTNLKSVEDLRIELQNSASILLDKVIKKSEWDDFAGIAVEEKNLIAWMAVDNIIGYGIYTPLIYDQNITDIEIKEEGDERYKITCRHLYSRPKKVCLVDASINKTEVENLVKNIVPRIAGTVGDTALFKNDTLETAGEIAGVGKIRCTINRPPITKGYHVELRKHAKKLSIPELMALGEASAETFSLLWMFSLLSKMSVMFVGPVGSGKTTLLVASQAGAPESLVWGVVGDIDELQGISGDYVLFKTIAGDAMSRDLVRRKLLRKRKDKVIVQEIRDQKDAEDYISQRQQGEAILSTTHARSIDELVDRFRFNFQIPEEYVYKSIDAVVVMNERDRQIIETVGIMDHGGDNKIYKILEFDYGNNTWVWKNKNGEAVDFSSALRDLSTVPSVRNALRMQENPLTAERFIELGDIGVLAINELLIKCFKKQPSGIYAPIISDKEVFRLTKECLQTAYDLYIHGFKKDIAIERLKYWLQKQQK
ncbi:MAG: ATPase, T2SS/T4P/T4SS family (plasmid) [Candidatus Methanoperedens sp.]|nr:MAG: ATPase, T2SS/T4P/T4SS family [Candidatus Methanoperedens sp.]